MISEDQIVTRAMQVTWGGEVRNLPVLPMKPADEWRHAMAAEFEGIDVADLDTAAAIAAVGDKLITVMLAYDRGGVLGSREWIEEHVTDDELGDAFIEAYRRSFRLGRLQLEMTRAQLGRP